MSEGALSQYSWISDEFTSIRKIPLTSPSALFTLPNGKQLAYETYGAASGLPLLYFHDGGSSRLECAFFHRSARQLGYRLIAVDRPGIGCSDFYSMPSAAEFGEDVLLLMDHLGIGEFGVMSLGAGGVYALHLAHACPGRVLAHLSLAGVPGKVFNESSQHSYLSDCWNELTPLLVKFLVRIKYRFFPDNLEQSLARFEHLLSNIDRKALNNPRVLKTLALDHREVLRRGYLGVAQDLALCFRKLDFRLQDVHVPTFVWQGSADRLASRADCEYLVARMPRASFYRVPSRGHFFFVHNMDEIFTRLRLSTQGASAIAA